MWALDWSCPGTNPGGLNIMTTSNGLQKLLLVVGSLLLVGSIAAMYWFSTRLDAVEARIEHGSTNNDANSYAHDHDDGNARTSLSMTSPAADAALGARASRIASNAEASGIEGISKAEELKRDSDYVPPAKIIQSMDRLMVNEPRNPAVEAKQQRWLKDSASATAGDDVPKARDVATVCQGRRCLVSASFADVGSAQEWAMRYLLSSGGRILSNSRTVIVPGTGGAATTLQLYLF